MAYTKKKKRKKRQPEQYEAPMTDEEKAKIQYKDDFQKGFGSQVEDFATKLDGKGKQIMYGVAALGVLVILLGIFYTYQRRQTNNAQTALGNAIEISNAIVTDTPQTAGDTRTIFKTSKARSEAAIKEFETVIEKHGGDAAEKAKYFIAVNRLTLDRDAGIKELQDLTTDAGAVGSLSKFALAQAHAEDGKLDEAAKLYKELSESSDPVVSKETVNFALAKIYEKQEKTTEAVELYFNIVNEANELKDSEDKPIPLSLTANEAKDKLEELDPEKAKEIKQPESPAPESPLG